MALAVRSSRFTGLQAAARPAAPRAVRLVVRAQAQNEKPALAQLAKPVVSAAVANVLLAMPAAAEAGKLFVSGAFNCIGIK